MRNLLSSALLVLTGLLCVETSGEQSGWQWGLHSDSADLYLSQSGRPAVDRSGCLRI